MATISTSLRFGFFIASVYSSSSVYFIQNHVSVSLNLHKRFQSPRKMALSFLHMRAIHETARNRKNKLEIRPGDDDTRACVCWKLTDTLFCTCIASGSRKSEMIKVNLFQFQCNLTLSHCHLRCLLRRTLFWR